MKWSYNELRNAVDNPIKFEGTLDLKRSLEQIPDILKASKVDVSGTIMVDDLGVLGNFYVKAPLVLKSTRSLKEVDTVIEFNFSEYYVSQYDKDFSRFKDTDIVLTLENDVLDLNKAVLDNILLHLPTQILTDEEKSSDNLPSGNDWNLLTEEDLVSKKKKSIEPRMAKLKDFFEQNSKD